MLGYNNRWLDIDMSTKTYKAITFSDEDLRLYLGGHGLGTKILFDRVGPGVEWDDPENVVFIGGGPLQGTHFNGTGTHCQVFKGPLSNGIGSVQAMGYLGVYLSMSGVDGLIISGKADDWTYLVVDEGEVTFHDARELLGKTTDDTELAVKEIIGAPNKLSSVYSIGEAGENLVKYACVVGDRGHVAAHNGVGAVWGSKNLKAIACKKGNHKVDFFDADALPQLNKEWRARFTGHPFYLNVHKKGTSMLLGMYFNAGIVPYKNISVSTIPEDFVNLKGDYYRSHFKSKKEPCYACSSSHCNRITVTEGKYTGFEGDEPEYELMAGMGTMIANPDPGAAIMLANQWDFAGMDGNEGSWLMGMLMECYENGVITKEDTGGIELNWGNVESVYKLIWQIARKETPFATMCAEGVKHTAEAIGGKALDYGVYQMRGFAPRGHDHRARWIELLDTAVSSCGTNELCHPLLPPDKAYDPDVMAEEMIKGKTRVFIDSLVSCMYPCQAMNHIEFPHIYPVIKAATGMDMTHEDAMAQAIRTSTLGRVFNLRHGFTPDLECPSKRYGSAPVDGPAAGKCIMDHWDYIMDKYYKMMDYDRKTGWPSIECLKKYNLDFAIQYHPDYKG